MDEEIGPASGGTRGCGDHRQLDERGTTMDPNQGRNNSASDPTTEAAADDVSRQEAVIVETRWGKEGGMKLVSC